MTSPCALQLPTVCEEVTRVDGGVYFGEFLRPVSWTSTVQSPNGNDRGSFCLRELWSDRPQPLLGRVTSIKPRMEVDTWFRMPLFPIFHLPSPKSGKSKVQRTSANRCIKHLKKRADDITSQFSLLSRKRSGVGTRVKAVIQCARMARSWVACRRRRMRAIVGKRTNQKHALDKRRRYAMCTVDNEERVYSGAERRCRWLKCVVKNVQKSAQTADARVGKARFYWHDLMYAESNDGGVFLSAAKAQQ